MDFKQFFVSFCELQWTALSNILTETIDNKNIHQYQKI